MRHRIPLIVLFISFLIQGKMFCQNVTFGVFTDLHYTSNPDNSLNYSPQTLNKLSECIDTLNRSETSFLVDLGDIIEQGEAPDSIQTSADLKMVTNELSRFEGKMYHVTGIQDAGAANAKFYPESTRNNRIKPGRSYYSFDKGGVHFVVLDASFDSSGNTAARDNHKFSMGYIPVRELEWLNNDLFTTLNPVVVFIHHQLSGSSTEAVKNAGKVRSLLEKSGKVICVFQGQNHAGQYSRNNGIHYYTLRAMANGSFPDNNSFVQVHIAPSLIDIKGYKNAVSLRLRYPEIRTYDLYHTEGEFDFEPWEEF